jgi:hypothetical protein
MMTHSVISGAMVTRMDDIDLHLAYGQQIAVLTKLLHTIAMDPAITSTNPGFLVCHTDGAGSPTPCLASSAAVGAGYDGGGGTPTVGDSGEELPRFVQFGIERDEITLDQPTSTLAIAEGERLLRERQGFCMERHLVPSCGGGTTFSESLIKVYPAAVYSDVLHRCRAAIIDAVWILHELWGLDPQVPITISAFTHDGSGRLPRLDGPLHRSER